MVNKKSKGYRIVKFSLILILSYLVGHFIGLFFFSTGGRGVNIVDLKSGKVISMEKVGYFLAIDNTSNTFYGFKWGGIDKKSELNKYDFNGKILQQYSIPITSKMLGSANIAFLPSQKIFLMIKCYDDIYKDEELYEAGKLNIRNQLFSYNIVTKKFQCLFDANDFEKENIIAVTALNGTNCLIKLEESSVKDNPRISYVIVDIKNKKVVGKINPAITSEYIHGMISPDKNKIALRLSFYQSGKGTLQIYDLNTGALEKEINDIPFYFTWNFDGSGITSITKESLTFYDFSTEALVTTTDDNANRDGDSGFSFAKKGQKTNFLDDRKIKKYKFNEIDLSTYNIFPSINSIKYVNKNTLAISVTFKNSKITRYKKKYAIKLYDLRTHKFTREIITAHYGMFNFQNGWVSRGLAFANDDYIITN